MTDEKEPENPYHVSLAEFQRRVYQFHSKFKFAQNLLHDLNNSFRPIEAAVVGPNLRVNIVDQITHDANLLAWYKVGNERATLMQEELAELMRAWVTLDKVQLGDALADLMYVVLGTAVACGIEVAPLLAEVHRSNMTKIVGEFKPVKGADYSPPDLLPLLQKQRIIT